MVHLKMQIQSCSFSSLSSIKEMAVQGLAYRFTSLLEDAAQSLKQ